jgi:hypothetical protein
MPGTNPLRQVSGTRAVAKGRDEVRAQVLESPGAAPLDPRVDPFDDDAADKIDIDYPFWLKPIKATEWMLAFKIADEKELREALQQTREHIETIAAPFNYVLSHSDLPQELAGVDGCNCIAEGMASGDLHTVEGYVCDAEVYVHGAVDSINYPDSSSFFRYQYPSSLPNRIQQRMIEVSHKVISRFAGIVAAV